MNNYRWRTVDIVVASILAVAFGVVFWAWGLLWNGPAGAIFGSTFPPAAAAIYGVWLLPAVLAPLIIRKPGAAIYTELVAAIVSALLGTSWGISVLWYGLAQGAAGELGFLLGGYRRWNLGQSLVAAALAGATAAGLDLFYYYGDWTFDWKVAYVAIVVGSTLLFAGVGGYYLTKALAGTGALDRFPSGRSRDLV
ncbi:ECF transporter S component [Catellatospora citrea]|uniref:ABC transporter permease n=1 Tax=Catellatospora citrea TaxID=53366 RepID=A0A8J3NWX4_9ACTN|nr:ECF transporter S component [Catellatospora citrea]RKE07525.1 energy-coupling factor transport system substrate-specific component [Catellatospora citrea]GIF95682.1 ABC transporter permease [Catellatospora citrea]